MKVFNIIIIIGLFNFSLFCLGNSSHREINKNSFKKIENKTTGANIAGISDAPCNQYSPLTSPTYSNLTVTSSTAGLFNTEQWSNKSNLIDADLSNFASFSSLLLGSAWIEVKDNDAVGAEVFQAGSYAGFAIEDFDLLAVGGSITVTTYLGNSQQESITLSNLLGTILTSNGLRKVGFVTTQNFDRIRLSVNNGISLLNTIRAYYAEILKPCDITTAECNVSTALVRDDFGVITEPSRTGFDGLLSVGTISNLQNVTNSDVNDFGTITFTAGVLASASVSSRSLSNTFPAGYYAGYEIANSTLLQLNLLGNVEITTYLDGVEQESKTASDLLLDVPLLSTSGRVSVGFITSLSFNEIRLTLNQPVSLNLGSTDIYQPIIKNLCEVPLDCNETYFLNEPDFPVVINSDNTGVNGAVCAGCSVSNTQNAITQSNTDFATLTTVAGVAATSDLSVLDGATTYPEGSTAGFVIEDTNGILQVDLFNSITICTYLDGVQQECESASNLINLDLLVNLIGPGAGRFNVGFVTTQDYDEIQISLGSLVGAVNNIRVYGAFVDTRNVTSSDFNCCPTTAPEISNSTPSTSCPDLSFDLNTLVTNATPPNSTLVWFDGDDPLTDNQLSTPESVSASGVYYAFFYNNTAPNDCYGPASAAVNLTVQDCPDSDNDGVIDFFDSDDDNDGVADLDEVPSDPLADDDNDGVPAFLDDDDNNDTIGNDDGLIEDGFDTDNDGVPNHLDLDSDNDGIADIVEAGGTDSDSDGRVDYPTAGDPTSMPDVDGDGVSDDIDNVDGGNLSGAGEVTDGTPLQDLDTDSDTVPNRLDLDSDDDAIPDNVEGQTTQGYIAPNGSVDGNGIDTAYTGGFNLVDTDGDSTPDYLDSDSDDDGISDLDESFATTPVPSNGVGVNGLSDDAETTDDYTDPNGNAHDGTNFALLDSDNDTNADGSNANGSTIDFDFREGLVPDLIPAITASPSSVSNSGTVNLTYRLTNIGDVITNSATNTIRFIVSKPNSSIGTLAMDTPPSGWTVTDLGGFFLLSTSTENIQVGFLNNVSFTGVFSAASTVDAEQTFSITIDGGSGGESEETNNDRGTQIIIN